MAKRRTTKAPRAVAAQPPALTPQAFGEYESAGTSIDRGWIWVPNWNPREDVSSLTRSTLIDRTAQLYRNNGRPRRVINCITRMVTGTGLMPEPMTRDTAYNDAVKRLWAMEAESPKAFSLSKKFSFSRAQRALKRAQLKTGDAAMVPARVDEGGLFPALRFALYDGSQIGSGLNPMKGMYDGVLTDEHDAAVSYRFLGRDQSNKLTQSDIEAANVLFFTGCESTAGHRGVSCLAHALNNLADIKDIHEALGKGIKMSSYQAWVIEQQLGTPERPGGVMGPGARPNVVLEDPKSKKPMTLEKFLGKGQIEELKPGQQAKILHDQRPHPNVMSWDDAMMREVIAGTDYPYEVLWKIEALGGANSRFVLADCQSKLEVDQEEMVEQVLAPAYIMLIQNWEARGLLPPCSDPDWWMHEWLTPARLTVDFGRDGRIYLDQWVRGHITLKSLYGYKGEGWKRQTTQWLEEIAWRKTEMKRLGLKRADLPATSMSASMVADPTTNDQQAANNDDLENDDDL